MNDYGEWQDLEDDAYWESPQETMQRRVEDLECAVAKLHEDQTSYVICGIVMLSALAITIAVVAFAVAK